MGRRARRDQVAQRINSAVELLNAGQSMPEAIRQLSETFGLSSRQARRYVEHAQVYGHRVDVPEPKQVFTVKLSHSLVQRLKEAAKEQRRTLSSLVEQAIQAHLDSQRAGPRGGGATR